VAGVAGTVPVVLVAVLRMVPVGALVAVVVPGELAEILQGGAQ